MTIFQFFNTYILYVNTTANLQGQYCALYSETWSASYATNSGQYRGNDHYLIEYSYAYSNSTNAGTANYNGAVHQASKDISYSTLQPFCSSYLGYTIPVVTVTATSTTIPVQTVTQTATVTVTPVNMKRALSTPPVLTKYPATVLSAACSLQATKATVTSTITGSTAVVTGSTSLTTTVLTATVTYTPAPTCTSYYLQFSNGTTTGDAEVPLNGQFNGEVLTLVSSTSQASTFTISSSGQLLASNGDIANIDQGTSAENVYFNANVGGALATLQCVVAADKTLTCSTPSANQFQSCPSGGEMYAAGVVFGAGVQSGCTALNVTLLPAC